MKEGKAPALGDWVGGMAAPGGPPVPQVEEGRESSFLSPPWGTPKSWRAYKFESGTSVRLRREDFGNLSS